MPVSESTTLPSQSKAAQTAVIPPIEEKRPADDAKICWAELKQYPYQPDHQVELLHLQAEADALLMKLQHGGKRSS